MQVLYHSSFFSCFEYFSNLLLKYTSVLKNRSLFLFSSFSPFFLAFLLIPLLRSSELFTVLLVHLTSDLHWEQVCSLSPSSFHSYPPLHGFLMHESIIQITAKLSTLHVFFIHRHESIVTSSWMWKLCTCDTLTGEKCSCTWLQHNDWQSM